MGLPAPEPGLVISFAYLWHHEHQTGHDEGRKDRPTVIVLSIEHEENAAAFVTVLPITHSPPESAANAIEIPAAVKRHLGLDAQPLWVIVSEGNEFQWPGCDLRKIPNTDRYDYGFLPPRFFNKILEVFGTWYESGRKGGHPATDFFSNAPPTSHPSLPPRRQPACP